MSLAPSHPAQDIETLGVSRHTDLVTVISMYDADKGFAKVLRFVDMTEEGDIVYNDDFAERVAQFTKILDDASSLCTFNGLNFDIPFVQTQFKIPNATVQGWVLKTFDILEMTRRGFGRTFNLNLLLQLNGFNHLKTGSGLEAVHQAQRGDWDELESYCLSDSRLTWEISSRDIIFCPEGYQWRKAHGGRSHDPDCVFRIDRTNFPDVSFSFGPLGQPASAAV
jgi:hypothetical protein